MPQNCPYIWSFPVPTRLFYLESLQASDNTGGLDPFPPGGVAELAVRGLSPRVDVAGLRDSTEMPANTERERGADDVADDVAQVPNPSRECHLH